MENMNNTTAPSKRPPLLLPELLTNPPIAKTPTKKRSLSDSTPVLGPSPKIDDSPSLKAKGDGAILATPSRVSRRSSVSGRGGLQLQMPARDSNISSVQSLGLRGAQSPQAEFEPVYGSPSSVLPRHSRGLDFSRACTNLHHSTLAEQSSPDSSPTVVQRGFRPPSRRNSSYSMMIDSPRLSYSTMWSGSLGNERLFVPRSVGSTNAMTSEASSSSSDEDDMSILQDEPDDTMIATPHIRRADGGSIDNTPFAVPTKTGDPTTWSQPQSPGPSAFASYRRHMLDRQHSRNSRSSWTSRSRTASPDAAATNSSNNNYSNTNRNGLENRNIGNFTQEHLMRSPPSRRDSLSMGIGNGLHITSSNESGDENTRNFSPMTPGVVKRPVTRRSNMLPKSKNFARIRAALQEEAAPVDSEARRESEVVKQVRVKDVGLRGLNSAMPASPDLTPSVPNLTHESSEMSEIEALSAKGGYEGPPKSPEEETDKATVAPADFQSKLYDRSKTPPPPPSRPNMFRRHRSSSGFSEDISMDSPFSSTPPSSVLSAAPVSGHDSSAEPSGTTQFQAPALPSAAEITRKAHNKRRRDDDFDPNSIKRRAVSPGVSVQNSPVLSQSPASTQGGGWGKSSKSSASERSSTGGSGHEEKPNSATTTGHVTPVLGPTRVGLQGMVDTNDGLMNMSIE